MKRNYDEVAGALKRRLPAATLEVHGRLTEFIRRMRTIGAADFVWSVVLSRFASGRPGFDEARGIFQRLSGLEIWPRPFQMRFKAAAAVKMMQAAFETAVEQWRRRPRVVAVETSNIVHASASSEKTPCAGRPSFRRRSTAKR